MTSRFPLASTYVLFREACQMSVYLIKQRLSNVMVVLTCVICTCVAFFLVCLIYPEHCSETL